MRFPRLGSGRPSRVLPSVLWLRSRNSSSSVQLPLRGRAMIRAMPAGITFRRGEATPLAGQCPTSACAGSGRRAPVPIRPSHARPWRARCSPDKRESRSRRDAQVGTASPPTMINAIMHPDMPCFGGGPRRVRTSVGSGARRPTAVMAAATTYPVRLRATAGFPLAVRAVPTRACPHARPAYPTGSGAGDNALAVPRPSAVQRDPVPGRDNTNRSCVPLLRISRYMLAAHASPGVSN